MSERRIIKNYLVMLYGYASLCVDSLAVLSQFYTQFIIFYILHIL